MKKMFVKEIRPVPQMGEDYWEVDQYTESEDGFPHYFPDDALEWRCAEYGLDPNDIEGVLDVLMYEHYIPNPLDPKNFAADPAVKAGLVVSSLGIRGWNRATDIPVTLFNAPGRDEARAAHLMRIKHVKENIVQIVAHPKAKGDPFGKFASEYKMDHALIAKAKEYVSRLRAETMAIASEIREERVRGLVVPPPSKLDKYGDFFEKAKGRRP